MAQEDRGIARPQLTASPARGPIELALRSGGSSTVDLRTLPRQAPRRHKQLHRPAPALAPLELPGRSAAPRLQKAAPGSSLAAPAPTLTFDGLDRFTWGAGTSARHQRRRRPDVLHPDGQHLDRHLRQDRRRASGRLHLQHLHEPGQLRQPVRHEQLRRPGRALRHLRGPLGHHRLRVHARRGGNVVNPPAFQCFAVSKTGDPVSGGWNFYSIQHRPTASATIRSSASGPTASTCRPTCSTIAAGGAFQTPRV